MNNGRDTFDKKDLSHSPLAPQPVAPGSSMLQFSPTSNDSLSPFPMGGVNESSPRQPAPSQWTPGLPPIESVVEGLQSQSAADAALATATHDHLLLGTQVSPFRGAQGHLSPPTPSVMQGAGVATLSPPCTTEEAVAQLSTFSTQVSPPRGEQSTPYCPTPKQIRREKRASHQAELAAGGGLGGGESSEEETTEYRFAVDLRLVND